MSQSAPLTQERQESAQDSTISHQTNLLIDGVFCPSVSGRTFETVNPTTESVIAQVAEGQKEDIDRAVLAARRTLDEGPWGRMDARERGRLLLTLADLIETHQDELARLEVLDNGKPIREALGYDIPSVAQVFRYFGGWADKLHGATIPVPGPFFTYTRREPVGVCGLIIPWNFPLAMAAWKLAPALAAGCTTILKPAEQTPLSALRLGELAMEAGFPAGVLNIVPGFGPTAGGPLVRHPLVDKIAFTGDHRTARVIKEQTLDSMKRMTFELGGKSPNIVFDDAHLEDAVEGAFGAIFLNQGQNCCAGSRLFLHENIHDAFVEKLVKLASQRKIGNPLDPETEHGPQIDRGQFDKILHYIQLGKDQGAQCLTGGKRALDKGFYIAPTVFDDVTDDMAIATDEIFGPVVSILRFRDTADVIRRANASQFGLAAAVWTRDIDKATLMSEKLKAGTIWVNCYNIVDTAAPFGGYKMSGTGRELGEKALDAYTEIKTVTQKKGLA